MIIKIVNFQGDLSDISAETATLVSSSDLVVKIQICLSCNLDWLGVRQSVRRIGNSGENSFRGAELRRPKIPSVSCLPA